MKKYIPLMIGMVLPLIAIACGPDSDEGMTNVTVQLVQQGAKAGSDLAQGSIPPNVRYLKFDILEDEGPIIFENYTVHVTEEMHRDDYILVGFHVPDGPRIYLSVEAFYNEADESCLYQGSSISFDLTGEPVTVSVDMFDC